jgi:hypothetical protein
MIASARATFNKNFSEERYNAYIREIENLHPGSLEFRVAETPVFVPSDFKQKMLDACDDIIDFIQHPEFIELTNRSIPEKYRMLEDDRDPEIMVFDFGVCSNAEGKLEPQLIEMQGFPSLYAYQLLSDEITSLYAGTGSSFSSFLNGFDYQSYSQLLKDIILGNEQPEQVILLEIFPEKQKTRIDFHCTEKLLGIKTVCLTKIYARGDHLFYKDNEKEIQIKRIFNRVIFDDLEQYELNGLIDFKKHYDVLWIPHPNWFYRISKFTLPFINHPNVPQTFFLNELKMPVDLTQFVLKPLFSFAGQGVIIDVTPDDIEKIKDPENWILQRKVEYANVILTPDVPAKAEIRLFFFRKNGWPKPIAVHNLARLSKGKMIGTRYNKDKTWVGGSMAYFEI